IEKHEDYISASKEMVRADHLIYVSLKYSRTVDVIKSVVSRLIEAFEFAMKAVLKIELGEDELKEALHGTKTMCDWLARLHPEFKDDIEFYQFMRKLNKAPVKERLNEFRRHVTLVTEVDGKPINVKIETVEEYNVKVKEFIQKVNGKLYNERDINLEGKN
ncbi:hypothetical protein KY326_04865, partial [Candidatus Woesearchaeota archaeon]|nr:hypothetical protein [Candidatus Woesearchaeota archaeon]